MTKHKKISVVLLIAILVGVSCQSISGLPVTNPTATLAPLPTPTLLPPLPVQPGAANPDEPVFITGDIEYTSPFFLNTIGEPFVLLEDQSGFIQRDIEFEFPLQGQAIGPVTVNEDNTLSYSLSLPAIPQGTQVDLDHDNETEQGVQVFAVAYWSNTWGGPFLEDRDGGGWSNAYASTITDPDRDNEIIGGTLVVWAPDETQGFPTGFGSDNLLFTDDDPTAAIPAGYSIVDLDQEPFRIYKEARPTISLNEGDVAVNDFSSMEYADAFEALFGKVSKEYPFTEEKGIDWQALHQQYAPKVQNASAAEDFYRSIRDFALGIPDAHVSYALNPEVFYQERGGGLGMVLNELSDGRVIVTQLVPGGPAEEAGIQVGAEIVSWSGLPMDEAISQVTPDFGPYSTEHHKRLEQVVFLTRMPPETQIDLEYKNPGDTTAGEIELEAVMEYDSLFAAIPSFNTDEISPPIEGEVLDQYGLAYLKVNTFSDDYRLLANLWDHYIQGLIDNDVPGLIIDLRINSGGSADLTQDFAGYFFDEEISLYDGYYYSDKSGKFESDGVFERIEPAPLLYDKPIAVLVSPYCVSACEGFAYALSQHNRAVIIGHDPTAGAFGEVGRGQYELPEGMSMQFPTGRPETPDGKLLIEGVGVIPDIIVPVTQESALGSRDAVLEAAIESLLDQTGK